MYFKITDIDSEKYPEIGMVGVTASYYLEEGDEGYDKYVAEYPNRTPFRHHEKLFDADVTDTEILDYFQSVSDSLRKVYLSDDIHTLKNDSPIETDTTYLSRRQLYDYIKTVPADEQTPDMQLALAKITAAEEKVISLKEIFLGIKE